MAAASANCKRSVVVINGEGLKFGAVRRTITSLDNLNDDLVTNILSRLSPKILLCYCRCVCKLWRNIIDSPSFIRNYIDFTEGEEELILSYYHDTLKTSSLFHIQLTEEDDILFRETPRVFPIVEFSKLWIDYLGYGLFLGSSLASIRPDFLYNPLRGGEFMKLPRLNMSMLPHRFYKFRYGLGFDITASTYKLVQIYAETDGVTHVAKEGTVQVLILGTSIWRVIPERLPDDLINTMDRFPVSVCGDLHWKTWEPRNGYPSRTIITFDSKQESFRITPLPTSSFFLYLKLFAFKSHLALADYSCTTHMDIWLLKDYHNKEWAKEFTIRFELLKSFISSPINFQASFPVVGHWKDGILLNILPNSLIYYNLKTNCVRRLQNAEGEDGNLWLFRYSGTLLSLKNYGDLMAKGNNFFYDLNAPGFQIK